MCLITKEAPQTAEKDLIVYKVLRLNMTSQYHTKTWELGVMYEEIIKESKSNACYDIEDELKTSLEYGWIYSSGEVKSYGQGFHFAFKEGRLHPQKGEIKVECTIPKGATYYRNPSGLGITNKIVINKVLNN